MPARPITIFFSWQSDLDQEMTTHAVRKAMRSAIPALQEKYERQFDIDESTRNLPGSPNIPIAIIDKIRTSDIFVADITSVTKDETLGKSFPNSNVVFELGYAVAHLGWSRIIMFLNRNMSKPEDAPFDFDRQRMSPYTPKMTGGNPSFGGLNNLAFAAIDLIVSANPPRPRELEGKSDIQIKHDRDVSALRRILSLVSTTQIDHHLQSMPEHMFYSAAHIADVLREVLQSNDFKLYDQNALNYLREIADSIRLSLESDPFYTSLNDQGVKRLIHNHNPAQADKRAAARASSDEACLKLAESLRSFTDYVREHFLEIDLDAEDRIAKKEYTRVTGYRR